MEIEAQSLKSKGRRADWILQKPVFGLYGSGCVPYVAAVPNAPKPAAPVSPAAAEGLPFEQALQKLESIVEAMESEELPLESLLSKYEEGTRLAKTCQEKLAEAELKIQQLEKNASGEMKLKPLATANEA